MSTLSSKSSSSQESSADSGNVPDGVTRIDDSLYELYSPRKEGRAEGRAEVEIIFFHGLQLREYSDAYWKTWSSDGTTIWPQTLLGTSFPNARIRAVSYDSSLRKSDSIPRSSITGHADGVPVILVGHSFGGLAIKKLLLDCTKDSKEKQFLLDLSGIFYYATPHGEFQSATFFDKLPGNSQVLKFFRDLGKNSANINNNFKNWRRDQKIPTYTIAEGRITNLKVWGVNSIVVEEASAKEDSDSLFVAAEDHLSICKPKDRTVSTFELLEGFIKECVSKAKKKLTHEEDE